MTIKVYISGICGSQEVRKQQQRVLFILQSLPIDLQVIDITEPGRDEDLTVMQEVAKKHDKKTQLPPQIFNGEDYCGDYADFEMANDDDEIMRFLKLEEAPSKSEVTQNNIGHHETNDETSDTLQKNIPNGINEINNVTKEQDVELISSETNPDDVKDTENPEIAGESNKEESKVEESE